MPAELAARRYGYFEHGLTVILPSKACQYEKEQLIESHVMLSVTIFFLPSY